MEDGQERSDGERSPGSPGVSRVWSPTRITFDEEQLGILLDPHHKSGVRCKVDAGSAAAAKGIVTGSILVAVGESPAAGLGLKELANLFRMPRPITLDVLLPPVSDRI